MEKIITISNRDVRLSNNIGWAMVYRDQFGRDIIPAIMPMFAAALDIVSGIVSEASATVNGNVEVSDVLKILDGDKLLDAVIHLSGLELVDFINIVWAMAKNADETIEEPRRWIRQFDTFPLDVVAPAVIRLAFDGMVSVKNVERLSGLLQRIKITQPSISTPSSSPDLSED